MKFIIYSGLLFPILALGQELKDVQTYYNKNQIKEYFYVLKNKKAIKHGTYNKYWPNGKIAEQGNYSNGKKDGKWVYLYSNGKTMEFGSYKDDKKIEKWYYFDSKGLITKIHDFGINKDIPITLDNYHLSFNSVDYPNIAKENQIEGEVILSFEVDSTCNCSNLKIVNTTDTIFNESALNAGKNVLNRIEREKKLNCDRRIITLPVGYKLR